MNGLVEVKWLLADGATIRRKYGKPIYSREFVSRQFVLCAESVQWHMLPSVLYTVMEVRSGSHMAFGRSKTKVLEAARERVRTVPAWALERLFVMLEEKRIEAEANIEALRRARPDELEPRRISKRRTEIFEKSQGKCHYCETALILEAGWHVEHMTPRSKGGTDLMDNLVAACPTCNNKKRTKTAEEFIAQRSVAVSG